MGSNALEQLKRETKDDAKLYSCIKELYEQGVPFSELKALIPDIRRTREQLHIKIRVSKGHFLKYINLFVP